MKSMDFVALVYKNLKPTRELSLELLFSVLIYLCIPSLLYQIIPACSPNRTAIRMLFKLKLSN
jgi:hypothetical protein